MLVFVVENSYEIIETMQINVQGLNVVCKYSDYEEKYEVAGNLRTGYQYGRRHGVRRGYHTADCLGKEETICVTI